MFSQATAAISSALEDAIASQALERNIGLMGGCISDGAETVVHGASVATASLVSNIGAVQSGASASILNTQLSLASSKEELIQVLAPFFGSSQQMQQSVDYLTKHSGKLYIGPTRSGFSWTNTCYIMNGYAKAIWGTGFQLLTWSDGGEFSANTFFNTNAQTFGITQDVMTSIYDNISSNSHKENLIITLRLLGESHKECDGFGFLSKELERKYGKTITYTA